MAKERSGFGFIGDGFQAGSGLGGSPGLLTCLFTSVAFDRVIRRIEWSAHSTLQTTLVAATQHYAACLIFSGANPGSGASIQFDARTVSFLTASNNPEILYCQTLATNGSNCNQFPVGSDVYFKLEAGRDYTVAVSEILVFDTAGGTSTLNPGGRTLNVLGENLDADALSRQRTHWR